MAAIEKGIIKLENVVSGDMLDVTIEVRHDIDLSGKTVYAEMRRNKDLDLVLKFQEADGSLVKTVASPQVMMLRFYKPASAMELDIYTYKMSVIMGTAPSYEDKQTIIEGTVGVVLEITKKPTA